MWALLWLACSTGTPIDHQLFTVGCGMCMFQQQASGCYWAARVDDKVVGIGGPAVPTEAELPSHAAGGMCATERQAYITGTLHDGKIIADGFELVPLDGAPTEAKPHTHKH